MIGAVKLVTFLFILKVYGVISQNLEGDLCILKDGNQGTCKLLFSCPSAVASIILNVFPPTCSFRGTQAIVCCEIGDEIKSTTSTTTEPIPTNASSHHPTEIHAAPAPVNRRTGEISEQKCLEYAKYAYETGFAPVLGIIKHRIKTLECPFDKLKLIVGGTLASRKEFAHMALVGYQTGSEIKWDCGGSIISEYFILTAAHCLGSDRTFQGLARYVRVGLTNITDFSHSQHRIVSQVIFHPKFTKREKYHDIGLLKLSEKIEFDTYARSACLDTVREIRNEKAIATGWGDVGEQPMSKDLLKVVLEFFDVEQCNKTYKRFIDEPRSTLAQGILDDSMICAGSTIDNRNTCGGDSGGPLQIYHEDTEDIKCMYTIIGITSFGKLCGLRKDTPGVYTRVYPYLKWIEDTVWSA